MQSRKLFRSSTEKMLGGVCGGLGTYFNVDPTLVRLVFVVATLLGGPGMVIYVFLWIITPREPVY
ncbi:MAG: PspC domain-containing protein [Chloroflexi bacterium]|nr:PspC domain-containing protein [Chloroflexota bacterium]